APRRHRRPGAVGRARHAGGPRGGPRRAAQRGHRARRLPRHRLLPRLPRAHRRGAPPRRGAPRAPRRMHELTAPWLVAFAIAQIVECPLSVRVFRVRLAVAFAASAITHPFVCFVFPWLWRETYIALMRARPGFSLSDAAYFVVFGAIAEPFAV